MVRYSKIGMKEAAPERVPWRELSPSKSCPGVGAEDGGTVSWECQSCHEMGLVCKQTTPDVDLPISMNVRS